MTDGPEFVGNQAYIESVRSYKGGGGGFRDFEDDEIRT
jgi:hypothetical protein